MGVALRGLLPKLLVFISGEGICLRSVTSVPLPVLVVDNAKASFETRDAEFSAAIFYCKLHRFRYMQNYYFIVLFEIEGCGIKSMVFV